MISAGEATFSLGSLVCVFGVDDEPFWLGCGVFSRTGSLTTCSPLEVDDKLWVSMKATDIRISFVNTIVLYDIPGPRADRIGKIDSTKTPWLIIKMNWGSSRRI